MALPKINLRDLFWLITVVAVLGSWWMDHRSLRLQLVQNNLDKLGLALDRFEMRKTLESEGYVIREEGERWKVESPQMP